MLVSGVASALILPAATRPAFADDLFCGYYSQNSAVVPQWARETPWSEGYVDVSAAVGLKDAKTFVRILGDQKKAGDAGLTPVLCLHGGPAVGFKYMDGLEVLGSEKREVASYDQIGCARSPYTSPGAKKGLTGTPPGPGTYTPALFANELGEVRRATGLDAVHVIAHGWGGMLALDHILGGNGVDGVGGKGIASLTLISTPPSYARLIADRRATLDQMPNEYKQVLLDGDEGGLVRIFTARGSDEILGATVVAPHAGDLIAEIAVAMHGKLGLGELGRVVDHLLIKHKKNIVHQQLSVTRVADVAIDLFAMIAVVSRASAALQSGADTAQHEALLARTICAEAAPAMRAPAARRTAAKPARRPARR